MSRLILALAVTCNAFRGPVRNRLTLRQPAAAVDVDAIKNAVAPSELSASSQAIYSWTGLALGAVSLVKPEMIGEKVLGIAGTGANAGMIRGAGLAAALLGSRLGRDSDSQAASSAALWLGGWAYMLRGAAGVAGRTQTVCALLALSALRRSGGLYNFVTTLDTNGLSAVLPKNRDVSMQNIVGMQMMAWGLGLIFAPAWLATNVCGVSHPAALTTGLAVNNLVLGGRVMSGSEADARSNGLLFFGGWAAIAVMARNAGHFSGQYAVPVIAWNAACAAYSLLA
mmetsp:Transcript_17428/g.53596  ORF Transcript_17428/g.53596 Transcript_17428/m.53596 type:complete len:283 (-) Transcript_17428:124-972(-)